MDEEKKNILAKLYTLRAGMSAISVRKEKIDKSNENIRVRQKKNVQLIRKINQQVQDNKEQIEIAEINLRYRPTKRQGILFIILSSLLVGIIIASVFLVWKYIINSGRLSAIWSVYWKGKWFKNFWNNMFSIPAKIREMDFYEFFFFLIGWLFRIITQVVGVVLAIALTIGSVVGMGFLAYKLFVWAMNNLSEFKRDKHQKAVAPGKICILQQSNQKLENEYQESMQYSKEEIEKEKQLIVSNTTASRVLYKTLYKEYKDFLDVRDWQNIDLLIFYFETGRVDTMKEALQEVDKQRRAEMVAQTVLYASNQICQIINIRMKELQSNMTECFSRLFDGLTVMHQSIISQIKTGQEIQRMQLQSLTTELNNAVQQRKNDSTIALAQDVRYIKTIVENEEIQKRNAV